MGFEEASWTTQMGKELLMEGAAGAKGRGVGRGVLGGNPRAASWLGLSIPKETER